MTTYSNKDKLEAILRELKLRRSLYPRWVKDGKLTAEKAGREIAVLEAIAVDYECARRQEELEERLI